MPNWKKVIVSGSDATVSSLFVTNAVTASVFSGSYTGSLFGTASWARNSLTASFVTGSIHTTGNLALSASYAITASYCFATTSSYPILSIGTSLYSVKPVAGLSGSNIASIFFGNNAGDSAFYADFSNFLGDQAGAGAYSASYSNFFGPSAGFSASVSFYSNYLGYLAGYKAQYADSSNFLGNQAGSQASSASNSNFLGSSAGISATNAINSNFFGQQAGRQATSASYSNLFGYKVGNNIAGGAAGIKSNNIIIGTNITLPDGTSNSINLGAIIFASGSYATTTGNPYSGVVNGKVGINALSFDATNPESLLVSGSNINTIVGTTNINNYAQLNIKNLSSGNAASADVVATNDTGTESGNFVDLGINSSTFAGTLGAANEAYLYHTGSNFLIGNTTRGATALKLFSGNDATIFPVIVTGSSAILTGSLFGTSSWAQNSITASYVANAVSFPYIGTAIISGSLIVTGSIAVTGSLSIGNSQFNNTSSITAAGTTTISSLSTGSYISAFYNYAVVSSTNSRAGQIMAIWNGSTIRYTEVVTSDIGSTSTVSFATVLSGNNVNLNVTAPAGWTVRTITNFL
jgi:hypothetical protein